MNCMGPFSILCELPDSRLQTPDYGPDHARHAVFGPEPGVRSLKSESAQPARSLMSSEPHVRKIRQHDVLISDIIVETPDTVTLVMTGPEPFDYKAGQFCTIDPHQFRVMGGMTHFLEDLKKRKEPPRAYSMASAPHEPLAITIKE